MIIYSYDSSEGTILLTSIAKLRECCNDELVIINNNKEKLNLVWNYEIITKEDRLLVQWFVTDTDSGETDLVEVIRISIYNTDEWDFKEV